MISENGEFVIFGTSEEDPYCLKTVDELLKYINQVGFLPLFKNEIPGFSVEERTLPYVWWTGNPLKDPWEWREILARSGKVAYGKFFDKKAGFISLEWFGHFLNWRRDGYDFDARWEDEKASYRQKQIMDLFTEEDELFSHQVKRMAGFGKDGEKNFEGTITTLQMETYLVLKDFRQRLNKRGEPYGWPLSVYAMPEKIWGREYVEKAYEVDPKTSKEKIIQHLKEIYPIAKDGQIGKLLKI